MIAVGSESAPTWSLGQSPLQVGRHPACPVRLAHPRVSLVHAQIRPAGRDGRFEVVDLSSRNGTFVNGKAIRGARPLEDGDRIQVAVYTFLFRAGRLSLVPRQPGVAFTLRNISATPRENGQVPIRDVILDIPGGRLVGLLGPSGAGKTSLLRLLAGIEAPGAGEIRVDGEVVDLGGPLYQQRVAYIPQDVLLPAGVGVEEALRSAHIMRALPSDAREERVRAVTRQLGLVGKERARAASPPLSGGELRRVHIGVDLLADPQALFLDEPTSGLDPSTGLVLVRHLRSLAIEGRTVIMVTHAPHEVALLHQVVIVGKDARGEGRLVYSGPPSEVSTSLDVAGLEELYERLGDVTWVDRAASRGSGTPVRAPKALSGPPAPSRALSRGLAPFDVWLSHFLHLTGRGLLASLRDRWFVLSAAAQAIAVGLAVDVTLLAKDSKDYLVFTILAAIWFGLTLSIRECVRERRLFARERLRGLRPSCYVAAKLASLLPWLGVECALFVGAQWLGGWLFGDALGDAKQIEPWTTVAMAMSTAGTVAMVQGLLVSSVARSEAAAIAVLPLLMVFQVLFSSSVLFDTEDKSFWWPSPENLKTAEKKHPERSGAIWTSARLVTALGSLATISRPTWEPFSAKKDIGGNGWVSAGLLLFQASLFAWLTFLRLSQPTDPL